MTRHHRKLTDEQARYARLCDDERSDLFSYEEIAAFAGVPRRVLVRAMDRAASDQVPAWAVAASHNGRKC